MLPAEALVPPGAIAAFMSPMGIQFSTQGTVARISLKVHGIACTVDLGIVDNIVSVNSLTAKVIFGIPLPYLRGLVVKEIAAHLDEAKIDYTIQGNSLVLAGTQFGVKVSVVCLGSDGMIRASVG